MVRSVTVKPLASVTNTAPTSLTIDGIGIHFSKDAGAWQFAVWRAFRRAFHFGCSPLFPGSCDWGCLRQFPSAGHCRDDLAAVEATVLDENVRSLQPADDNTRDVDAGHVGFQRIRVGLGTARFGIEANSVLLEELKIGVIAGHGEDLGRRDAFLGT